MSEIINPVEKLYHKEFFTYYYPSKTESKTNSVNDEESIIKFLQRLKARVKRVEGKVRADYEKLYKNNDPSLLKKDKEYFDNYCDRIFKTWMNSNIWRLHDRKLEELKYDEKKNSAWECLKKSLFKGQDGHDILAEYEIRIDPSSFILSEQEYLRDNIDLEIQKISESLEIEHSSFWSHEKLLDFIANEEKLLELHNQFKNMIHKYCKVDESSLFHGKRIMNLGTCSSSYNERIRRYVLKFKVYKDNKEISYINDHVEKSFEGEFIRYFEITRDEIKSWIFTPEKCYQSLRLNIFKDVQRVEIIDERLIYIHMHKHFDPIVICVDSFDEAREIEDLIQKRRARNNEYKMVR